MEYGRAKKQCAWCPAVEAGLYASHDGAVYSACVRHRGVCHAQCWPDRDEATGLVAVTVTDASGKVVRVIPVRP